MDILKNIYIHHFLSVHIESVMYNILKLTTFVWPVAVRSVSVAGASAFCDGDDVSVVGV